MLFATPVLEIPYFSAEIKYLPIAIQSSPTEIKPSIEPEPKVSTRKRKTRAGRRMTLAVQPDLSSIICNE